MHSARHSTGTESVNTSIEATHPDWTLRLRVQYQRPPQTYARCALRHCLCGLDRCRCEMQQPCTQKLGKRSRPAFDMGWAAIPIRSPRSDRYRDGGGTGMAVYLRRRNRPSGCNLYYLCRWGWKSDDLRSVRWTGLLRGDILLVSLCRPSACKQIILLAQRKFAAPTRWRIGCLRWMLHDRVAQSNVARVFGFRLWDDGNCVWLFWPSCLRPTAFEPGLLPDSDYTSISQIL